MLWCRTQQEPVEMHGASCVVPSHHQRGPNTTQAGLEFGINSTLVCIYPEESHPSTR